MSGWSMLANGQMVRGIGTAGAIAEWQNGHGRFLSRFRDWGTLPYAGAWRPMLRREWIEWIKGLLEK